MAYRRKITVSRFLRSVVFWGALVIIAAAGGAVEYELHLDRGRAIEAAEKETRNLSTALVRHAELLLLQLDDVLKEARTRFGAQPSSDELRQLATTARIGADKVKLLAFVGKDGFVSATSAEREALRVYVGDREHIGVHFSTDGDFVYLGKPIISRVSLRWSLPLTRKVFDAAGNMTGVMVAALDPVQLSDVFKAARLNEAGQVALIGFDGVYRARGTSEDFGVGVTIHNSNILHTAMTSVAGNFLEEAANGLPGRIYGFHKLNFFSAFLASCTLEEDALAAYHERADHARLFMLAVAITLLAAAYLTWRNCIKSAVIGDELRQSKIIIAEKARELQLTLDNMTNGIILVDQYNMVRIINARAVDILGLSPRFLTKALPFQDVVADLGARGDFAFDLMGSDLSLQQAVDTEVAKSRPLSFIRMRANGMVVEVVSKPLPEGGFVRSIADISERYRRDQALRASTRNIDRFTQLATRDLQEPMYEISSVLLRLKEAMGRRDYTLGLRSIQQLSQAAQRGREIANDLVRYSQQNMRELELGEAALDEIVLAAFDRARLRDGDGQIKFHCALPRLKVACDGALISDVFDSLIASAVALRDPAHDLEIKIYGYFDAQFEEYNIYFSDNGDGFTVEDDDQIFAPFAKLGGAIGQIETGIELAIAHALIEKHGWKIRASSVVDVGSTFTLTIPKRDILEVGNQIMPQEHSTAPAPAALSAA